jgi:hypothetical protein
MGVSIRDQFEFLMSEWINGSTFAFIANLS